MELKQIIPGILGITITEGLVSCLWTGKNIPAAFLATASEYRLFARPTNNTIHLKSKQELIAVGNIGDWILLNSDKKLSIVSDELLNSFISFRESLAASPGVEAIMNQRLESINKRGFDVDYDKKNNDGELKFMAMYALTLDDKYYPDWLEGDWKGKWKAKSEKERLVIAGDLLSAAYDQQLEDEKLSPEETTE